MGIKTDGSMQQKREPRNKSTHLGLAKLWQALWLCNGKRIMYSISSVWKTGNSYVETKTERLDLTNSDGMKKL